MGENNPNRVDKQEERAVLKKTHYSHERCHLLNRACKWANSNDNWCGLWTHGPHIAAWAPHFQNHCFWCNSLSESAGDSWTPCFPGRSGAARHQPGRWSSAATAGNSKKATLLFSLCKPELLLLFPACFHHPPSPPYCQHEHLCRHAANWVRKTNLG